jgi:hypothetical protein
LSAAAQHPSILLSALQATFGVQESGDPILNRKNIISAMVGDISNAGDQERWQRYVK